MEHPDIVANCIPRMRLGGRVAHKSCTPPPPPAPHGGTKIADVAYVYIYLLNPAARSRPGVKIGPNCQYKLISGSTAGMLGRSVHENRLQGLNWWQLYFYGSRCH